LAEVLRGAGVDPALVTPELARDLGRILRIVVSGVLDVLEVRKRIKEEFRLGVTTIRPKDNNPLKMSADVDDALHNMLVKRSAAYMPPVEAFEDAFGDIRGHQLAMLEGMRAAFDRMMERFDPQRLQDEFDQQGLKGSLLSGSAKSQYWELYCEKIRDMVRDSEASFRDLFGDQFADAYEEHLKRQKARGRGGDQ
jgi:type VI secretion system FHA domain protein